MSPSAISHAIRKLEVALGTVLFERGVRQVYLTPPGESLRRSAVAAFHELRQGLEQVAHRGPQLLRVHSAPSFAAQWLNPRLSHFLAEHPQIDLRLAAGTDYARFTNDDFDVDIIYGLPRPENTEIVPLGEEVVTPLCGPALASKIHKPEDLFGQVLITSENKLVRWHEWFAANGLATPVVRGMRFDRSFLAIATATAGLGVALESTRLAEQEIESGRLVAPLAGRSKEIRYVGHRILIPKASAQQSLVRAFVSWVLAELHLPDVKIGSQTRALHVRIQASDVKA